jgi:death-on-curing protein
VRDWVWIGAALASAIHDRQLAEHGGPSGTRDQGALESALARPKNLAAYGEPDAAQLAAGYASGIVHNHPFVDGNKRAAWIIARLFLMANGAELHFDKADAIRTMFSLAAGDLGEDELAEWFRERVRAS